MKRVYVAGPITKGDYPQNIRRAIDAGIELLECGYSPYVPHLDLLMVLVKPMDFDTLIEWDKDWLILCDALLRLPGESKGADIEEAFARENHIPVFYSIAALVASDLNAT